MVDSVDSIAHCISAYTANNDHRREQKFHNICFVYISEPKFPSLTHCGGRNHQITRVAAQIAARRTPRLSRFPAFADAPLLPGKLPVRTPRVRRRTKFSAATGKRDRHLRRFRIRYRGFAHPLQFQVRIGRLRPRWGFRERPLYD